MKRISYKRPRRISCKRPRRVMPTPPPPDPIQGKNDPRSLFLATRRFCKRRGIPVGDPEYESAVNWAVFIAIRCHEPGRQRSLINWCIFCALRDCANLRDKLSAQRRRDLRAADRTGLPPVVPPVPRSDFEILSFVAAHRHIAKAARLLGMTTYKLKLLLCDIQLRIRDGVANAPKPPVYLLGEVGDEEGEEPGMSYHPG